MPHHEHVKVAGRVGDVFVHRFVIETKQGKKVLADLGPKGLDAFPIESGLEITAEGEMKPSELKVERIARTGEAPVAIAHKKKDHGPGGHPHPEHAEPSDAKQAVVKAGFEPIGEPRRKPKHFEVLARQGKKLVECHVEFDGRIRKEKPVAADDHKWSHELKHAA